MFLDISSGYGISSGIKIENRNIFKKKLSYVLLKALFSDMVILKALNN